MPYTISEDARLHPFWKAYAIANLIINPVALALLILLDSELISRAVIVWIVLSSLFNSVTRNIVFFVLKAIVALGCGGAEAFGLLGMIVMIFVLAYVAALALFVVMILLWLNALYILASQ